MTAFRNDRLKLIEGLDKVLGGNAQLLQADQWTQRVAWRRYFRKAWLIKMNQQMSVTWQTHSLSADLADGDKVIFVWAMGLGSYSPDPEPTGQFTIYLNDHELIPFCQSLTSRCWSRGDCRFYYEVKRRKDQASYGLGYLLVPANLLRPYLPAELKVEAADCGSQRWFMLCQYGEGNLATGVSFTEPNAAATSIDDGLAALLAGPQRTSSGKYNLYWGDLHVHSSMVNYIAASPEENYEYGRHVSQLDFMALTDQDHFLSAEQFKNVEANANSHYVPDEFVTFIGYEWSSRLFGHRNVIFRGDRGLLIRRHDSPNPYDPPYPQENRDSFAQLCRGLKEFGQPCMLLPHHPAMTSMGSFNWAIFDPDLETAVEIYSLWGSSEYQDAPGKSLASDQRSGCYVQDALARGYVLGIIGSGETGDGHPGNAQWRRKYAGKGGIALTPLGGGLAAVWAESLTREAIFDAIKARRCYGTTNSRIILDFKLNGHWMGERITLPKSDLKDRPSVDLNITVKGTDRIEGIYVFRNGRIAHYAPGYARQMSCQFTDYLDVQHCLKSEGGIFAYYYVRVIQADGHLAWSSPIWLWLPE